jgi:hypothetical protein
MQSICSVKAIAQDLSRNKKPHKSKQNVQLFMMGHAQRFNDWIKPLSIADAHGVVVKIETINNGNTNINVSS